MSIAANMVLLLLSAGIAFAAEPDVTLLIGATDGTIRPLLGVNAGPLVIGKQGKNDFSAEYCRAGVTQVRTHDFYGPLDMSTMYPDQDADPALPASYSFEESDRMFAAILKAGFEPYLRIGDSWHNDPKFPKPAARAPRNRPNWTRAAIEVVRHYSAIAGSKLRYVEIWNEPDHPQFWDGTQQEFFILFDETARAVKSAFPGLKVGGPGFTPAAAFVPKGRAMTAAFLDYLRKRNTPLDFFSWHIYSNDPAAYTDAARYYRKELDQRGFKATESHVTEYNTDERRLPQGLSAAAVRLGAAGAAIITADWIVMQRENVAAACFYRGSDMAMDQPTFYGMFRANGAPKRAALAFSFWARMAACRERLAVSTSGAGGTPLWTLAGGNVDGSVALLIANPSAQRVSWRITPPAGRAIAGIRIEEINDAKEGVIVLNAPEPRGFTPGYTVQLVSF